MRVSKSIFFITLLALLIGCSSETSNSTEEVTSEDNSTDTDNNGEETQQAGGELRIALHGQPPSLDSMMQTPALTRDTSRLVFETLLTVNSDYQAVPMLAESFDMSDDETVYTFKLREGITFHNGKQMTSEDVVASMNRWLETSPIAQDALDNATFEAEDDYTVVLDLAQPSSLLLDIMASTSYTPAIMPKEVIDEAPPEGVSEYIGTGPFQFVEWNQDHYIHFTKYDEYQPLEEEADGLAGKKEALVDDIYFDIVTDASTRLAGLQTGEYDIATQISYDNYEQLENDPNLESYTALHGPLNLLYNKEEGLAADVQLRQAINTALDLNEVMQGATAVDETLYSLNSEYMQEDMINWKSEAGSDFYNQNDMEKAQMLLDEADYNDEEFRILTSRDYSNLYGAAIVIQEQLSQLGINVTMEVYDAATFSDYREDPTAWDALVMGTSPVSTPIELLLLSPDYAGGMDDSNIIDLRSSIMNSDTPEEAQQLWDELQGYAWEEYLPFTKLGDYNHLHGLSNNVEGFGVFSGPLYWNVQLIE